MQIYKVGGYVRDKLLGLTPHDCDYVVVGSSPQEMLARGFIAVGRDFPVFLHPQTKEEYALARQERKIAAGHHGFKVYSTPEITLEQDLMRRDLTINAIAEDEQGNLIDPHNGQLDLKNKTLRHVSAAFSEDPLRILRVARFAAQLNFRVADETMVLLRKMAQQGEGLTVSRERITGELGKALNSPDCHKFFTILEESGNLTIFFPLFTQTITANWQKFLSDLSLSTTKQQRWLIIALLLNINTLDCYQELTLSRNLQKKLIKLFWLNHLLKTPITATKEILDVYRHLEIWRNYAEFDDLCQLFLDYLQNIRQDTKIETSLQNYQALASELRIIPQSNDLKNLTPPQVPQAVQTLRIQAIHRFSARQ